MSMTPDAKAALSSTIRGLRERLLTDLRAAAETEYRLSIRARDAGLDESARTRRSRLETWIAEQVRAQDATTPKSKRSEDDFRREAEKQAAYTLLNRLVLLRLMEAPGPSGTPLRSPAVLTGGWESRAYLDFRQLAPDLVRNDETEGYAFLLRLVFEDLAIDLPGLYGPNGIADLIPVPASTLRYVVDRLNAPELETCWTDEMTLGWVYQYWNDPDREALDAKLNSRGKLEPYEIASKTQMFTERYMVDWLLQNSLGPVWLAICKKHGWTPEVERDGTLAALEARRADWRAKRDAGTVELTALMPLYSDTERCWAYYLPQPVPEEAATPESIRDLKLLDPAVGSGHFLVVALDLLVGLYREEARHRGNSNAPEWTERAIVERTLTHNLHGIDLDPRAVQIAAAALWLRARQIAPGARPDRLNLVASSLRLASLPEDDPALVELRREIERETGIPASLTDNLIHALRGADYLGSLLKIDHAVEEALERYDTDFGKGKPEQRRLFAAIEDKFEPPVISRATARETLLSLLETFLARHTNGDDLGLRLRGEQLAAGVRFARMLREQTYDVLVTNPPYQGTSKMADSGYLESTYPNGKTDLYAAFLIRGLELVREGGFLAQVSMNGWMFTKQYSELRESIFTHHLVRSVADLMWCAFEQMRHSTIAMYCLQRSAGNDMTSTGLVPSPRSERDESIPALKRKRAAVLAQVGRCRFDAIDLKRVPGWPLVYWWNDEQLRAYGTFPLLGTMGAVRSGMQTGDNARFVRKPHEINRSDIYIRYHEDSTSVVRCQDYGWVPYVQGGQGRRWIEPCSSVLRWRPHNLAVLVSSDVRIGATVRNEQFFFREGVAFTPIGASLSARVHRYASVCDTMGASFFAGRPWEALALLNGEWANDIMAGLNPGIHFQVGDLERIPFKRISGDKELAETLKMAFALHESHREPSVEFRYPGPSPWRCAQAWADSVANRPESAPLPPYVQELDEESRADHLSFALGVSLGRFSPDGKGILDPAVDSLDHALREGLLFLDTTLEDTEESDGLGDTASVPLRAAWAEYGAGLANSRSLREWLALEFFKDVHKRMYGNRPIYWPLSSSQRTFVAWISVHRFTSQTLRVLMADHLAPALMRLDGQLSDLRNVRVGTDRKAARDAERSFARKMKEREELKQLMDTVEQCADRGAPPTDGRCPTREQESQYVPNLDDGVLINSAALWPLLEPQWKDPKKWWRELATAKEGKDYDWSHLAMRYWPTRVDGKCQIDPSLAVAHGCFWRYHPARAWSWELRLQYEIGSDFRITEAPYRPGGRELGDAGDGPQREAWLRDHPDEALSAIEKEAERRMGRGKKRAALSEMRILEPGLWTSRAVDLWNMELRLAEKQGRELRIVAPDEPEARAQFERDNLDKVAVRIRFLENLVPPGDWLEETGGEQGTDNQEADALAEIDGEEDAQ